MKYTKKRKTNIRYIKCCKCNETKKNTRKPKPTRKLVRKSARKPIRKPKRKPTRKPMRKSARKPTRKKTRKKIGAAPLDYFKDYPRKEQLERVLDLVKESTDINENVKDFKTGSDVTIDSTNWSKLTYFNAFKIMISDTGNDDDMKNIVYMLKHDIYKHKKANKEEWKKHLNEAIFKNNYMDKFKNISYNGPTIKEYTTRKITLKYLTIILLEHRLKVLDWFTKQSKPANSREANSRAAESVSMVENVTHVSVPNKFNLNKDYTHNDWNKSNNENVTHESVPNKFNLNKDSTPNDWNKSNNEKPDEPEEDEPEAEEAEVEPEVEAEDEDEEDEDEEDEDEEVEAEAEAEAEVEAEPEAEAEAE